MHQLPYQETQTFKDVLRELRSKVTEVSGRPPILSSQSADKCQELRLLFPPEGQDRRGRFCATTSKLDEIVSEISIEI